MNEKTKNILKIVIVVFLVVTALYFWRERALNFFLPEDDLAGLPCYTWDDVAVIEIRGEIVSYFLYTTDEEKIDDPVAYDAVSAEEVVSCIENAKADEYISGVIFEVDSGGGSAFASEEIANAIKGLDKPTVVVIREIGASGGYLIASATEKIFASEWSDIGSIGITMSYLDYSKKNEKDGITYQQISAGEFKDTGDPDRPLTDKEKELLLRDTNIMHESFIKKVSDNRNLDVEKVRQLADGSTMLGLQAKESGLIDEIGDINSAKAWLENKAE